ncbi:unnamed protein product [Rotaria sordida]|uniref:RING-type E3 ubiquitin transferase n=1 Tax=Rotaria sordida TaxID=392033 RepID=A0A818KNM1_9BILA|nr:unnamed protein product [Rotaria sordida]CAF0906285.1 unnamed protein product [Rotaria sordida]CAF0974330.1 unnamed protein product [Rotaria sordida]CAF1040790.1 unnamed protein product [Rotaria sordida]CAF1099044.1 unnamed protein product [Rotaria sordida]
MMDWNWLWVIGQLGVSYGFYRWWKSNDTFLAVLEVAPDIDIDDLKNFSSLTTTIDYATICGLVQANDSKPNSVIKSQFVPDCTGVIHRLTVRIRKLERLRSIWAETKHLISDLTRHVSFRLVSPKENFIRINKPLEFNSIEDQLEVTHIKFDPNITSSIQKFIDTFIGDISTGTETKEEMLLINVPLTGVGRLEKRSGIWYLIPHEQWGGILTRLSRHEILSDYRKRANIARLLSVIFGITAGCTAIYIIYQYYSKRQRRQQQINQLPIITSTIYRTLEDNHTSRLQCVICLENEIIYNLQPCSHLGLCRTCAQQLQSRDLEQQLCPICRTPIQQYQRVYLA